ncbi:hypothetical protein [Arthrobacter sp. TMS1-12-1]
MTIELPSRYEDLRPAFRAQLRPNRSLIEKVKLAHKKMSISKGVRFLPVYGLSGAGKTSAALELATHLQGVNVVPLPPKVVDGNQTLESALPQTSATLIIAVIDQYEEAVARREDVPTRFVEALSRLDRARFHTPVLFIWLTTSRDFQRDLAAATSRNSRLLVDESFELQALPQDQWSDVIEETFDFHNEGKELADFQVLRSDIQQIAAAAPSLGTAIEQVGEQFDADVLHDISEYQLVMVWPVTDGVRLSNVRSFTNPRAGYKLDWNSFYRALNSNDQSQLPLDAYNKARLYFDVRLVPVQVADLHSICLNLDNPDKPPARSYVEGFRSTHLFNVVSDTFEPESYRPMKDHGNATTAPQRSARARDWYSEATRHPTHIGRRIAAVLTADGFPARAEREVKTPHSRVVADVLMERVGSERDKVIIELKAFSPDSTTPSKIATQIRGTLRKHAELAGYLERR